jgi:PAS domain S-box-containing protein
VINRIRFAWGPIAVFLAFTVVVAGTGYAFFAQIMQSAKSDAANQLTSIGKLKAEQIRYYIERYEKNARSIARLVGQGGMADWLGRGQSGMPAPWRESLLDVVRNRGDDALLVLDPGGNIRFGVGQYTGLTAEGRRLALQAATEIITVTSEIYPGDPAAPGQALLDIFVPIMRPDGARAAGVLVLRSNLAYLYGLIQTWPVESRSAEAVLVRLDGDDALFLNELRFRKRTALRMRVPLSAASDTPAWPSTAAARGETGIWEALDYRGEPVLAYTLPVPGTGWGMVVKEDLDEVLAPVQKLRNATIGVVAAFIMLALLALLALLGATRRRMDRELAEGRRIRELNESLEQRVRERTAQLRESEERLQLMTNSVKDYAIIMLDPRGHVVTWNDGAQRLKGYAEAEIVGQSIERFYSPEDVAAGTPARLLKLAAAEGRSEDEGWRVRKDGTRYYADMVLTAMRDPADVLVGFAKITRDVTERKQTEAALELERGKLAAAFDNTAMGLVLCDGQGGDMSMNAAALRFHGFNSTADMHRRVEEYAAEWELRYPDGRPMPYDEWPLPRAMRGDYVRDYDTDLRNVKTGYEWACSYTSAPVRNSAGDVIRIVMTLLDVTERKQTEQKAQAQRERAETLLQAVPDPVVIVDREGRIAVVNARTEAVFGYARAELLGQPVELLIPERLHGAHLAQRVPYQEQPRARAMGAGRELFARRKDGSEFAVDVSLSPLATPEGTLVISTVRDVTERKQAERRIRGQMEHLTLLDHITRSIGERQDLRSIFQVVVRSIEDSLPVDFACVCLHDPAANALRVTCVGLKSEALAHDLTLDEKAVIGIDDNGLGRCVQGHLVYEPDIGAVRFPFPERLARGGLGSLVMAPLKSESRVFGVLVAARREAQGFSSVECEFLRQLSEHVALAAHQAQLYGALQQAYDDLRQTQQAMMQEERLRVLGQMASGIAHDINNALSPVSLYTESLLETERNLSDRARGYLETIQRAVEDVAQTVARMREFYRPREAQLALTPVELNSIVQQVVDLTRARWSDQPLQIGIVIRALTELAPDLPKIMGVESEIREALTNLVFNAVDAMPEGGTLTLRTRLADADPERPAAVVEVVDNGIGMDEETRRRCLEPFFTTKGERGTGLGLATVFGMVQRHSAELEIESASGAGTTVRLVFAIPAPILAEPGRPAAPLKAPSRLRLLLIDDDPILLKSLRDALETDGHVIVTANGGEAGIAAFRLSLDRGEAFAAVITDLGMPYIDGRRVAAAVKETSPATPVILLTGWGQRLVAEGDIPPHVDRVLAKPPKLREVRDALAQLCQPGAH